MKKFLVVLFVLSIATLSGCGSSGGGDDPVVDPAAPVLTVTAGGSLNTIIWEAVTNATSYNIYYGTTTGFTPSTDDSFLVDAAGTVSAMVVKSTGSAACALAETTFTCIHSGLANGTAIYYVGTSTGSSGTPSAVSSTETSGTPAFAGAIDTSFGTDGKSFFETISLSTDGYSITPAVEDASGNLYIFFGSVEAGLYSTTILKLDSAGALVATFGTDGVKTIADLALVAAVFSADGTYLYGMGSVEGEVADTTHAVFVRLDPTTGALDLDFGGGDGIFQDTLNSTGNGIWLDSDGNLSTMVGRTYPNAGQRPSVAKYTTEGASVTAFGTNGGAAMGSGTDIFYVNGTSVDSDGNFFFAGSWCTNELPGNQYPYVAKMLSNGTADPDFGIGGFARYEELGASNGVTTDADGNVYVAGNDAANEHCQVLKYSSAGAYSTIYQTGVSNPAFAAGTQMEYQDGVFFSGLFSTTDSNPFLWALDPATMALDTDYLTAGIYQDDTLFSFADSTFVASNGLLKDSLGRLVVVGQYIKLVGEDITSIKPVIYRFK
ncbi:hypothetical protein KKA47_03615 [bacterium]|nr:hypothetical protein [bacterium]